MGMLEFQQKRNDQWLLKGVSRNFKSGNPGLIKTY